MPFKFINPFFFFIFFCFPSFAQSKVVVTVRESLSMQQLDDCNISVLDNSACVITFSKGSFKIFFPQQVQYATLCISMIGYKTDTFHIDTKKDNYDILLKPNTGVLNEVIVTTVSRSTTIRESPVTITRVSSKEIEQSLESNIIDVLSKNVSGLQTVKTGPNISKPFIRGLGYNRVLTLYDGIRQEGQQWGDEHGIEVDAYNIGSAEIIKGPASIMYGSDAIAGVVSLIPYMVTKTNKGFEGKYISEFQHNNGLIGNGIRLNFSNNNWSLGLRGSYRIAKNYSNKIDGRVYNTGFRETNISTSIQRKSNKGYSNLNFTFYNNLQGIPDGSRDSLTRKFTKQIFEGVDDDIKNRPIISDEELNSYQLSPLHQQIQHCRIYTNNHYRLGQSDLNLSLAFQQNVRREFTHPTIPKLAGLFVKLNTFNYSFSYNAPTMLNTEITVGLNGMYQINTSKTATDFPIPNYNLFDAGSFIYAKWKQKKWSVSGGLRYDNRQLSGDDFYTKTNPITGFNYQVFNADTSGAYLQFTSFNKNFNGTSFSIGATYNVNPNINIKANIGKGYRSPSITEYASNGLDPGAHIVYKGNRNFKPEFNLQQDVGANFAFSNFTTSISLFYNKVKNYIYLRQLTDLLGNEIIDAQGNKTFQYEQSAAHLYGAEILFNFHPNDFKGFIFNNSFSVVYGSNNNKEFKSKGIYGEYMPLIPPARLLSSLQQTISIKTKTIQEVTVKLEMDYAAAQNRFLALHNTESATPAFTLFNLSVQSFIKISNTKAIQLQIHANNLFDKIYQSHVSRLKYFEYYNQSPNGFLGMFNMGRNICMKMSIEL